MKLVIRVVPRGPVSAARPVFEPVFTQIGRPRAGFAASLFLSVSVHMAAALFAPAAMSLFHESARPQVDLSRALIVKRGAMPVLHRASALPHPSPPRRPAPSTEPRISASPAVAGTTGSAAIDDLRAAGASVAVSGFRPPARPPVEPLAARVRTGLHLVQPILPPAAPAVTLSEPRLQPTAAQQSGLARLPAPSPLLSAFAAPLPAPPPAQSALPPPTRLIAGNIRLSTALDGSVTLTYPPGGTFDVVVVDAALPEPIAAFSSSLSGSPVHTAFLNVGTDTEWTIHYCLPSSRPASQHGSVVTLGETVPLKAPYLVEAALPAEPLWRSPQYLVLRGILSATGHLEELTAIQGGERASALLTPLRGWIFRPASSGTSSRAVEILIVIPPLQSS